MRQRAQWARLLQYSIAVVHSSRASRASRVRVSAAGGAGCVGQLPAGDGAGRGGWCGGRRRRVAGASNTDVSLRSTYSFLGQHIDICHRIRRSLPAARRGGCLSGAGRGVAGTTPIILTCLRSFAPKCNLSPKQNTCLYWKSMKLMCVCVWRNHANHSDLESEVGRNLNGKESHDSESSAGVRPAVALVLPRVLWPPSSMLLQNTRIQSATL